MTRSVPEWQGKTDDAKIPPRVLLRVFLRFDGRCQCGCNRKIVSGERWQGDHKIALINGGAHRENNLQPILIEHHKTKTAQDVAEKSKTYSVRKRHYGIKTRTSRPLPGSRASEWKKKVSGEWVRR